MLEQGVHQANFISGNPEQEIVGSLFATSTAFRAANWTATTYEPPSLWPRAQSVVVEAVALKRSYASNSKKNLEDFMAGRLTRPSGLEAYTSDLEEEAEQCRLLRDIFPPPMVDVMIDPSWLTSTVLALARGIQADQSFDLLPILADALEDEGCGDENILSHCRGPGPHVRGCWVVDELLGKS